MLTYGTLRQQKQEYSNDKMIYRSHDAFNGSGER
jgi:hypothetical protein